MVMAEMQIDFGSEQFTVPIPQPHGITLRQWSGLIKAADLFVGCDSVGQHIAYATETPVVAVIASTYPVNISYPNDDKVKIIDLGETSRRYAPIRIAPDESTDRMNDGINEMSNKQEDDIIKAGVDLVKKFPHKEDVKLAKLKGEGEQQQGQVCPVHGVVHDHGQMHQHQPMQMPQQPMPTPASVANTTTSQFGIGSSASNNLPPFLNPSQEKK